MANRLLMKPLFVDGMFNREGKRIRAIQLKTISNGDAEYTLWISAGKAEKDYPRNANDTHYLMIRAGEYLVPCGETEHDLEQRSGYTYLNKEWYGDFEGRNKYFEELREGKTYEESEPLIKSRIAEEEAFISEHGKEETAQFEHIKSTYIDRWVAQYIDARDNNGKLASYQGAAILGELEICDKIASKIREAKRLEDIEKRKILAEQRAREAEEKARKEKEQLEETESIFINGGTIDNGEMIVKIADKYGINIPLRTKGWILNTFAECTLKDDTVSMRYWKRKSGKGSQTFYTIVSQIKGAITRGRQGGSLK